MGDAGNWCWIKHDHQIERWFCYYIPLIIVMIINIASYCHINKAIKSLNMQNQNVIIHRMVLYVGAFLFIRSWSVLNRFVELIDGNVGVFPLMFLHSLFSPIQGVANALVYGFNKKLKAHYYNLCCSRKAGIGSRVIVNEDTVENPVYDDTLEKDTKVPSI